MAYAHTSDLRPARRPSLLASLFSEFATYAEIFGAAQRVSSAYERRVRPDNRDLAILGINGPIATGPLGS